MSTRISNRLTALLGNLCSSTKYSNRRYDVLSLFMEESGLHAKLIWVPFTGVVALHSILDDVWKLLMLETSMGVELVMLVHASMSP